eukprot:7383036-Prymnesium_polylepis.2
MAPKGRERSMTYYRPSDDSVEYGFTTDVQLYSMRIEVEERKAIKKESGSGSDRGIGKRDTPKEREPKGRKGPRPKRNKKFATGVQLYGKVDDLPYPHFRFRFAHRTGAFIDIARLGRAPNDRMTDQACVHNLEATYPQPSRPSGIWLKSVATVKRNAEWSGCFRASRALACHLSSHSGGGDHTAPRQRSVSFAPCRAACLLEVGRQAWHSMHTKGTRVGASQLRRPEQLATSVPVAQ